MSRYSLAAQTARYDQARAVARWDVRNRHPLTHHNQENTMSTRPNLTITVTGYAAADAEQKFLPNGTPVTEVTVPYTPRRKNQQTGQWEDAGDTTWVKASVWRDDAEPFAEAVTKGTLVTLTGRPKVRAYTAKTGEARADLGMDVDTWGITPRRPRSQQAPGVGTSSARPNAAGQWDTVGGGQAGDPWASEPAF